MYYNLDVLSWFKFDDSTVKLKQEVLRYIHTGTHIDMDMRNHLGYCGMIWNGWTTDKHHGSHKWMKDGGEHRH